MTTSELPLIEKLIMTNAVRSVDMIMTMAVN